MTYFEEPNGDYMAVDLKHPYMNGKNTFFECRACCLENNPRSIQTCSAQDQYIDKCKLVKKESVPLEYMSMF